MNDLAGRFDGKTFVWPVRVYYEDTDAGGVVYHSAYLNYAERARTEMLRHLGLENSTARDRHGIAFVVRNIEAEYLAPARLDDLLEVTYSLVKLGGATLEGTQTVRRNGEDLVRMKVRVGCAKLPKDGNVGGAGRLPVNVREILKPYEC